MLSFYLPKNDLRLLLHEFKHYKEMKAREEDGSEEDFHVKIPRMIFKNI